MSYGLKVTSSMFEYAIKYRKIIKDPQRFGLVFDNKMYYLLFSCGMLNIYYMSFFDDKIQELHNIRAKYRVCTKDKLIRTIKTTKYFDRYCFENATHCANRGHTTNYAYLVHNGIEPTLRSIMLGNHTCEFITDTDIEQVYKNMEIKMYGSIDNLINLMETPYDIDIFL